MSYNDVRFEVQIYTDKGPTIRFKNKYNKWKISVERDNISTLLGTSEKFFTKGY